MLKANYVSDQMIPQLVFNSIPVTITDPVGDLNGSHPNNALFLSYEAWLVSQIPTHEGLALVGNKEADSRLAAELRDMKTELRRLGRMKMKAWE